MRHIDCAFLYIQQVNAERAMAYSKVLGARNPADMCTKGLPWAKIAEFVNDVGAQFVKGRAELASKLCE